MTLTPLQLQRIRAIGIAKAALHPELARPLTLTGAKAVLRREKIGLEIRAHPRPAQLVRTSDGWKIVVDERSSDAERLVVIVHEIAHRWLGHVIEDEPITFDQSEPWHHDARELEANHFTELLIAGPDQAELPIRDRKRARKVTTSRASQIPLGTRQPPPSPKLPAWLEDVERDADAIRLRETAHAAAREDAARYPVSTEPRVSFTIRREAWQHVHLPPGHGAGYSPMVSVPSGTEYEYVECDLTAARTIVEQIARAGHRREAVLVRRRIRESESGT